MQQAILLLDRHKSSKKRKRKEDKAEDLRIQQSLRGLAAAIGIDTSAENAEQVDAKLRREARLYTRVVASPFPGLIFSDLMRCAQLLSTTFLLYLTKSPVGGRTRGACASFIR